MKSTDFSNELDDFAAKSIRLIHRKYIQSENDFKYYIDSKGTDYAVKWLTSILDDSEWDWTFGLIVANTTSEKLKSIYNNLLRERERILLKLKNGLYEAYILNNPLTNPKT